MNDGFAKTYNFLSKIDLKSIARKLNLTSLAAVALVEKWCLLGWDKTIFHIKS